MPECKVSVHIIVKETTTYGALLLRSCLESLYDYADQLVLVDNGCTDLSLQVIKECSDNFKLFTLVDASDISSAEFSFSSLRNKALENTDPNMNYIHWIDSDEVYFPDRLDELKMRLVRFEPAVGTTMLCHFMFNPIQYQYHEMKRNIFRHTGGLKWSKGVHEQLLGVEKGPTMELMCEYLHFGYTRRQWEIMLRWLRYALIEHGNVNCYRKVNEEGQVVDYFRDWRTPNTILNDRKDVSHPYVGPYPESFDRHVIAPWLVSEKPWYEWLDTLDEKEIWIKWQKLYQEKGNWRDTLEAILELFGWKEEE